MTIRQSAKPRKQSFIFRAVCFSLLLPSISATLPMSVAFAGDCDGTAGNDTVNCATDPTVPDAEVGLGFGDDTYTQDSSVFADEVMGDALEDGSDNAGDGGNDELTVDGIAFVVTGDTTDGNGGDDEITLNGGAFAVVGDDVTGNGGDDTITVNGLALVVIGDGANGDGGDDIIIINGEAGDVEGDEVDGSGGDDLIIINGRVNNDVTGDCATLDGGDDAIVVNGEVDGDILGDCVGGAGGDDTMTLGNGSEVWGLIDGEDGTDTLQFGFLRQSQLAGYSALAGSLTYNGNTYTWANFEQLIGLLEELGFRFIYRNNGMAALADQDGIKVFNEDGPVAFIPFASLTELNFGEDGLVFQGAHSQGWFVVVTNTGPNPNYPDHDLLLVTIYDAAGAEAGQFNFSY